MACQPHRLSPISAGFSMRKTNGLTDIYLLNIEGDSAMFGWMDNVFQGLLMSYLDVRGEAFLRESPTQPHPLEPCSHPVETEDFRSVWGRRTLWRSIKIRWAHRRGKPPCLLLDSPLTHGSHGYKTDEQEKSIQIVLNTLCTGRSEEKWRSFEEAHASKADMSVI